MSGSAYDHGVEVRRVDDPARFLEAAAPLLLEDEARHNERDKLLLDHFLDNADDRPFRRRNQQPIPTSCGRGFFDDDVHVGPREALGRTAFVRQRATAADD